MKNGDFVKRSTISAGPKGVSPIGTKLFIGKHISLKDAKYLVDNGHATYETAMVSIPVNGDAEAAKKIEDARLAEEAHETLIEKATELRIEITDDMDDEYIQLAIDEVEALSPQEKAKRTRDLNQAAKDSEADKLDQARKDACEGCEKLPDNCVGVKECEKFDDEGVPVTKPSSWS